MCASGGLFGPTDRTSVILINITIVEFMKKEKEIGVLRQDLDANDVYPAPEGECNLIYGMIGSGKTYIATADIIRKLYQGRLVYGTWPINVEEFDDRLSFFHILKNLLLGRNLFYKVNCPKNYHYINAETGEVDGVYTFNPNKTAYRDEFIEYLNKLNHCDLYIDEAWRVIDSYQKTNFSIEGRNLILVTRHKYRTVTLIAQRPTSIHVTARGNMNRFYKCKKLASWPIVVFRLYEFQEMVGETVDEEADPISVKTYWGKKSIFNAYNSYYYGELDPLHKKEFEIWYLDWKQKILALIKIFTNFKKKETEKKLETTLPF